MNKALENILNSVDKTLAIKSRYSRLNLYSRDEKGSRVKTDFYITLRPLTSVEKQAIAALSCVAKTYEYSLRIINMINKGRNGTLEEDDLVKSEGTIALLNEDKTLNVMSAIIFALIQKDPSDNSENNISDSFKDGVKTLHNASKALFSSYIGGFITTSDIEKQLFSLDYKSTALSDVSAELFDIRSSSEMIGLLIADQYKNAQETPTLATVSQEIVETSAFLEAIAES